MAFNVLFVCVEVYKNTSTMLFYFGIKSSRHRYPNRRYATVYMYSAYTERPGASMMCVRSMSALSDRLTYRLAARFYHSVVTRNVRALPRQFRRVAYSVSHEANLNSVQYFELEN